MNIWDVVGYVILGLAVFCQLAVWVIEWLDLTTHDE